jgi:uncharacterized surface protein with fasciclin (FAS1) repeats
MKTIIDTAVGAGNFTTLLGALKAGSFIDTLRTPGPYTIFAPTDDAFKRLTPGALSSLLKDIRRLKTVLTYHVLSGTVAYADIKAGSIRTVEGSSLIVARDGAVLTVNGARIVQPDIFTSNGVIHAIDTVFMQKSAPLAAVA